MTTTTMEQPKRKKTGGTIGRKAPSAGPIVENESYSRDDFLKRTRMGEGGLRTAVRNGLKTIKVGSITFIRGSDFHEYLAKLAAAGK